MKVKTSELSGKALNYAVACAEGMDFPSERLFPYPDERAWMLHSDGTIRNAVEVPSNAMSRHYDYTFWAPSTDWAQGGPIIERERIGVCHYNEEDGWEVPNWAAWRTDIDDRQQIMGESALIAAMRCYVRIKLGDEVDVPEELL